MDEITKLLGTKHEDTAPGWVQRAVAADEHCEWDWSPDDEGDMQGDGEWGRVIDLWTEKVETAERPYTIAVVLFETINTKGEYTYEVSINIQGDGAMNADQAQEMERVLVQARMVMGTATR